MKDLFGLCGFVAGKTYNAVNTNRNDCSENSSGSQNRRRYSGGTQNNRRFSRGTLMLNRFFRENRISDNKKGHTCVFFLMVTGILSIIIGCLIIVFQPYDAIFRFKLLFSEGGETFEMWRKPDVDLYLKVYLFNITNKDKFLAGEEKLIVQEVGPYVYKENMEHKNVKFNDNGTLTTNPAHPLTWVPELSEGRKEDDILILPNIALLAIAEVVKDSSYFTKMGLNILVRQTKAHPLLAMTAKEFMFGYQSSLLTLGNTFMPSWIHFDKLGLIDRMYDFTGDYETVFTGEKDLRMVGIIDTYNGRTHLPHWKEHCGNVHGASDATKFPSFIEPNDTLVFFRKSVCRPIPQIRDSELVNKNGLMAYRYIFEEGALDNGKRNPNNKCYCRNGRCLPEGLIDVTDCYYGFPIAVSYPHFFEGDPALVEAVKGSNPDPELHKSHYYIEPKSGTPVDVAARFQINIALGDISGTSRCSQFKNMVLPLLWTEIGMKQLPTAMNNKLYLYLVVMPIVEVVVKYALIVLGVILMFVSVLRVLFSYKELEETRSQFSVNRKQMNYEIASEKRNSMKIKEMDVYYHSLLTHPVKEEKVNLYNGHKEDQRNRTGMENVSPKSLNDIIV